MGTITIRERRFGGSTPRTMKLSLILTLALSLGLVGCGGKSSGEGEAGGKSLKFLVITKSNNSPYWLAINRGAEDAAKKIGNIKIVAQAPAQQTDLAGQIQMFNNGVSSGVDGILLAAQQAEPLSSVVKSARDKGYPVVTVDAGVIPNTANSSIATDNVATSAELARKALDVVNTSTGSYAIITMDTTSQTGRTRIQGFEQEMKKHSGYKELPIQIANDDIGKARAATANLLQSHPDLNVIYANDNLGAVGAAQAVKASGRADSIALVAFDVDAGALDYLKAGTLDVTAVQQPYTMGYEGVLRLIKIIRKEQVPKSTGTKVFFLTPTNVGSPDAKQAISEYISGYNG